MRGFLLACLFHCLISSPVSAGGASRYISKDRIARANRILKSIQGRIRKANDAYFSKVFEVVTKKLVVGRFGYRRFARYGYRPANLYDNFKKGSIGFVVVTKADKQQHGQHPGIVSLNSAAAFFRCDMRAIIIQEQTEISKVLRDVIALHEFVHAYRMLSGKMPCKMMGTGRKNRASIYHGFDEVIVWKSHFSFMEKLWGKQYSDIISFAADEYQRYLRQLPAQHANKSVSMVENMRLVLRGQSHQAHSIMNKYARKICATLNKKVCNLHKLEFEVFLIAVLFYVSDIDPLLGSHKTPFRIKAGLLAKMRLIGY